MQPRRAETHGKNPVHKEDSELERQETTLPAHDSEQTSSPATFSPLLSRIGESAAGLAAEMTGAGAHISTSTLGESSVVNSGKSSSHGAPESSSNANTTWSGSRMVQDASAPSSATFRTLSQPENSITGAALPSDFSDLRDTSVFEALSPEPAFSEGQATSASDWTFEFRSAAVNSDVLAKGKRKLQASDAKQWASRWCRTDVQIAEAQDGMGVIDLLSQPGLHLTDVDSAEASMSKDEDVSADDLFGLDINIEQQSAIDTFRSQLPPNPVYRRISPNNPLNLLPDVNEVVPENYRLGVAEVAEWIDQWSDVLERYTDDVWGPDLLFVQQAQQDIKTLRQNRQDLTSEATATALRRLQMILQHIKLPP